VKGGISKPMPVSDALRRFAGADEVSRSGAVKLIWAHIKAKGLQVLRRCHITTTPRQSRTSATN
jgi:chromatin remodeling complex protein RSC6